MPSPNQQMGRWFEKRTNLKGEYHGFNGKHKYCVLTAQRNLTGSQGD